MGTAGGGALGGWVVVAASAVLALPATASASGAGESPPARQAVELAFTTTRTGDPTGSRFEARWRNPEDPAGKPHAMDRIVARLPAGFTYDTSALDRCHAADWDLMLRGAEACPPGSVVSRGSVVTDSGEPSALPRHMTLALTMFNTADGFVSLGEVVDPPFQPTFRVVSRNRIRGRTVTSPFPAFPSLSGPDHAMAFSHMRIGADPLVRGGRAYARTPPTCPRSGHWTTEMEFVYRDGVRQTETLRAPCRRARRPAVRIRGVPRDGCTSRPFTARIAVRGRAAIRRMVVLLDGRRVRTSRRRVLRHRIDPSRLVAGPHRLTVRARSTDGRLARRTVVFRTCPSPPGG